MTKVMLLGQGPGVGGAERVVYEAMSRASSLEVTVVAPEAQRSFAEGLGFKTMTLELPRIRTPVIGQLRLLGGAWRVARLARTLGAQVLYANAIRAMGYGIGARALGGPPLICHDHHLLAADEDHRLSGGLTNRNRFLTSLERWSDLIIVPSAAAAKPLSSDKVRVVPNGIDLDRFKPPSNPEAAKSALGLAPDRSVVGTLTRAEPAKGMGPFIQACARIAEADPSTQFLLAGGPLFPHEVPHYEEIRSQANELLGDRVVLTGPLEEPLAAFHAMDVMLHTSEPESFGLTVLEAMASGVPVIAFEWGAVPELIQPGTGVLVAHGDVSSMARVCLELLNDPASRDQLKAAGSARASEFSLDSMTQIVQSLIEEVVA